MGTSIPRTDKAVFLGALIAALALSLSGFVTYRPNRIVRGQVLPAHEVLGNYYWVLLVLCLAVLLLTTIGRKRRRDGVMALLGGALGAGVVFFAGYAATELVSPETPFARTSMGAGVWLSLFGAYLITSESLRGYAGKRLYRTALQFPAPVAIVIMLALGWLNDLSLLQEFFNRRGTFFAELATHANLAFSAVALGSVVGFALALVISRLHFTHGFLFFFINLFQTIPTLSFLGLLMAPLIYLGTRFHFLGARGVTGIGWAPAFLVLFAYTLLPVTGNALAGFRMVDPMVVEAARGMGMTATQIFLKIRLPLALPVILSGIRTALTQAIGNTILAGLIGAGGMGAIIFLGLAQAAPDLILLGTLPVVFMALVADHFMKGLARMASAATGGGAE